MKASPFLSVLHNDIPPAVQTAGVPIVSYAEWLGALWRSISEQIAVAPLPG
jgi:hypothetical protein